MGYPFEDLDDAQFERLVVQVGRRLFGAGVQSFAAGRDGGRDARFDGVAERFPSTAAGWTGITVFQAKHTNATNAHVSDPDFGGDSESSVLTKELVRVRNLIEAAELNHYFLATNRRVGATADKTIKSRISEVTGLPESSIFLAGVEYLEDALREHSDLVRLARIDPIDGPLVASSYEIAEVILAVAREMDAPVTDLQVVERTSFNQKNVINGMTNEFAQQLSARYLPLTTTFDRFLADPANDNVRELYDGAVEEFQLKIIDKRADHQTFDAVFNHLADLLINRDAVLARNKRLLRAMLFYMYWHCDIGKSNSATTQ